MSWLCEGTPGSAASHTSTLPPYPKPGGNRRQAFARMATRREALNGAAELLQPAGFESKPFTVCLHRLAITMPQERGKRARAKRLRLRAHRLAPPSWPSTPLANVRPPLEVRTLRPAEHHTTQSSAMGAGGGAPPAPRAHLRRATRNSWRLASASRARRASAPLAA